MKLKIHLNLYAHCRTNHTETLNTHGLMIEQKKNHAIYSQWNTIQTYFKIYFNIYYS